MIVFQIHKAQYDALDGTGAALFGRRWNMRGTSAVYASTSLALARAEVGAKVSIGDLPDDYVISEIEIDQALVPMVVSLEDLDDDWKDVPFPRKYQEIGTNFLTWAQPFIMVPSIKDPDSINVVLNPNHPNVKKHVRVMRSYPLHQ